MNLSEALDAALPEIPRARLTRVRPPQLDPDLIIREDLLDGEPIIGAFRRSNGNFYRFNPIQWQLCTLFDGERSYEEIAALFQEQAQAALEPEQVRAFAQNMDEGDFWYQSPQERNIALHEKLSAQRSRRAKRRSKLNVAHISFSAWDPDRYLTWLDQCVGRFVYSRWSVIAAVVLFLIEAVLFTTKWRVIGPDIPVFYSFTQKSFGDLVQFWLLFLILGFFHETAHGLTCKHYGGEVHRMGMMLIYLTPAFYVDITETWISATRLQRLATIIAGIWVEMIFCGFALIAWTNTQPGQWAHEFSYQIILLTGLAVIVINLNPLIKLDGYYFLTEAIGIPDLKERSTAFLSGWVQSRILRLPVEIPPVARRRVALFVLYAMASGAYSYLLLFTVIRFTYNIGYNWLAEFALIPAGALAFAVFRSRLHSLGGVAQRLWCRFRERRMSARPRLLAGIAAALLLLFLPISRDHESALYLIEPEESAVVYAATPGRVQTVFVQAGQSVRAGEPLLELKSVSAEAMRSSATAAEDAARYQTFEAELTGGALGEAVAAREASARSAELASQAQRLLVVRAPITGTVLDMAPQNLLNQDVGTGQPLLALASDGPRVARVFVPASALDRIPPSAEVSLAPPGRFAVVRRTLPPLQGAAIPLPPGLAPSQELKGVEPAAFYTTRLPLDASAEDLRLGMSGPARISGVRRSLFERAFTALLDLLRAHLW